MLFPTGAELKIRLPTVSISPLETAAISPLDTAAISQPSRPTFRIIRPPTTTGPPVQPPEQPFSQKKKKSKEEADAWAAKTRRRASRGIARAVAAVRRAEDSDSFDSDDDDEYERQVVAAPPISNQPKRGRGRPRKPGGFSCQLCPRRLATQAEFFQHLRNHYEKPDGEEAEPAADGNDAEVSERLEPGAEQAGEEGGPSTINVDIIAAETVVKVELECEQCGENFYSEEDLELHRKTHIREALAAEEESSEPESGHESEPETAAPDMPSVSHNTAETVQRLAAQIVAEVAAPTADPAVADQYEMKNLKKCDDCPKLFTTLQSVRNHRERMHNTSGAPVSAINAGKIEYECEECHVTYTSQKIYERHKLLHKNKAAGRLPHHCSQCGASFLTSMLLAHHAQKEHPETCQRRRGTMGGPARPNGRPPGSSNKKRQMVYDQIQELENGMFKCSVCGKESKSKNQLFYHISIKHKGERRRLQVVMRMSEG